LPPPPPPPRFSFIIVWSFLWRWFDRWYFLCSLHTSSLLRERLFSFLAFGRCDLKIKNSLSFSQRSSSLSTLFLSTPVFLPHYFHDTE
jgi:hypothetical protein